MQRRRNPGGKAAPLAMLLPLFSCAYIGDEHASDRLDPDEDGVVAGKDCDDEDPFIGAATAWYRDEDGDDYGTGEGEPLCDPPGYLVSVGGDCDDADDDVHPGAVDGCDGIDDDCDGELDEDGTQSGVFWYVDKDADGYGIAEGAIESCASPGAGWSSNDDDCDDLEGVVHPFAQELCDGVDTDCSGGPAAWEAVTTNGYRRCDRILLAYASGGLLDPTVGDLAFGGVSLMLALQSLAEDVEFQLEGSVDASTVAEVGLVVLAEDATVGSSDLDFLSDHLRSGGSLLYVAGITEDACGPIFELDDVLGVSCSELAPYDGVGSVAQVHPVFEDVLALGGMGEEQWALTGPGGFLATVDGHAYAYVTETEEGGHVLALAGPSFVVDGAGPWNGGPLLFDITYGDHPVIVENGIRWLLRLP